jgi:hypothetical protein
MELESCLGRVITVPKDSAEMMETRGFQQALLVLRG